jgi:hypothetical protein
LKTRKSRRRQAVVFLSLILIFMIICSAPEIQTNWKSDETQPVQTSSGENRHEFMLPISLPDSQVFNGTLLAKARFVSIQSRNKLLFVTFSSLLLLGCVELWKHSAFKVIQNIYHHKPEMSLRLGGHAPPAAIVIKRKKSANI